MIVRHAERSDGARGAGRVRRAGPAVCLGVVAALAACETSTPPRPASPPAEGDAAVRAAEAGLEVRWWAVDDAQGGVGRAMAPYADLVAEDLAPGWRAAGLRLLRVPRGRFETMGAVLPMQGGLQRQWFGMLGAWTPIIAGRQWAGRLEIALDEGDHRERMSLGPGRLRVLARCWSEPRINPGQEGAPTGADLRLELLIQHEEAGTSLAGLAAGERQEQTRRGRTFETLRASWVAEPGVVYVLVPETPGAEWVSADASNDRPLGPPAVARDPTGRVEPPTLGEAMLTDAPSGGLARTRVMVALIARPPERFELLRSAGGAP